MIQAIGLTSLPRRHQLKPAVDDLTFEARPGRVTVLLGPEGSGKTTALRLTLQLQPGRGTALFRGRPVHRIQHLAREVGVLLGEVNGHPGRTARGHLRMLAAAAGVPAGRADDVLDVVGLSGLAHQRMSTLSRGMDRRIGIACALLGDPHTLVLDEPAHDLSPRETAWLYSLLRGYAHQGGTVLVTSHRSDEAARLGDRVVSIDSGRLLADQEAADFVRTRLRPRVAVRTPYAERLVAVLTQEGRKAGRDRDSGPLKAVREGGTRVSVYGSSCSEVGELAYRNGILVHQLTDERGDTGDAHTPGPLDRADGRRTERRSPAASRPAAAGTEQEQPGAVSSDVGPGPDPQSGPRSSGTDAAGDVPPERTHAEPHAEPATEQVLLELEELEELEELKEFEEEALATSAPASPVSAHATTPDSRPGAKSPESEREPQSSVATDPPAADADPDAVLIATSASASPTPAAIASGPASVPESASATAASPEATPTDAPHAEADTDTTDSEAPTIRISDGPLTVPSKASTHDSTQDPSHDSSQDPSHDSSQASAPAPPPTPVLLKPLADPDTPSRPKLPWPPKRPPARPAAELPPPLHAVTRPGPAAPLRYELYRLSSLRSTWTAIAVTVALSLCASLVMARTGMGLPSGSGGSPAPAVRLFTGWPSGGVFLLPPAAVAAGLLGAFAFGEEFRYPALAPARSPVSRRLSLLAAKLAVATALAVLLSVAVAVVNAAAVSLFFGSDALALPSDVPIDVAITTDESWRLHIAAVFAYAAGCAWAGVLAAGIFRSGLVGTAVVVAVPLLLAPVVRTFLGDAPAPGDTTDGLPGRLEAALLMPWPPGTERWLTTFLELASQPVGCALALSLAALLTAYLVTALNSRAR